MRLFMAVCVLLAGVWSAAVHGQAVDLIEFESPDQLQANGWIPEDGTRVSIAREARAGRSSIKVEAQAGAEPYRGIELHKAIDLSAARAGDRMSFWVRQNFGTGMTVQLWTENGNANRSFSVDHDKWTRIDLDMDLSQWENPTGMSAWGKVNRVQFYSQAFQKQGQFLMLDGLSFTAGRRHVLPLQSERVDSWTFPQETTTSWRLGNDEAAWAISKSTGQVIGGWNSHNQQNYLLAIEGRYHLADRKSVVTGRESEDVVTQATYDAASQRIELTCTNPAVPDLTITKRYWIEGNKLYTRTGFTTRSSELQFITFNSQAVLEKGYRDSGFYMGGGDGGWPLIPAPAIDSWKKVLEHQNTTKGMVLNQPDFSFAHVRTRLDEKFVWPWYTGAIAAYCEPENVLSYTPDGWDMSLGTSKLSANETSYEQYISVFPGDWMRFLTHEYPSLEAVQEAYAEIPPTPEWVSQVLVQTMNDIDRVRRVIESTDEGYVMVLVDFGGSWADYYVDQGLTEGWAGGFISGEELREVIQEIKSISPRVKVGMYMWVLSTGENTRIYNKHPNWFRSVNKDGELSSLFPGVATNHAHLLSIPEAYDEILSQFDLVMGYLGTDFIYLDDPKAINPVDWVTGEYTRDDISYRMFLDIKKIAAKHGPDKMVFFNNMSNPYGDVNYIEARSKLNPDYWRFFAGNMTLVEANLNQRPDARVALLYYVPPFEREYINCILAMGWIPVLEMSDVIERRMFVQAAFEIGNGDIVSVDYSPDWKRDKDTNVESHTIQRRGDSGYLLSFVNHDKQPGIVPVELSLDSFTLDRTGDVYLWEYIVEDANTFRGTVTEQIARAAYGQSRWRLDQAVQRRVVYAGPYQPNLRLELATEPNILHQLYVTDRPIGVYSENGLPGNYVFNRTAEVEVTDVAFDLSAGRLSAQINSSRESAELLLHVPASTLRINQVTLDGKAIEPAWAWEGGNALPIVSVGSGSHRLEVTFNPVMAGSFEAAKLPTVQATGDAIQLTGVSGDAWLVTVEQQGRVMFNQAVRKSGDVATVPVSAVRTQPGDYTVTVRAVQSGNAWQNAHENGIAVHLPAAGSVPVLPGERPAIDPGFEEIKDVNRTIGGVDVLRSATYVSDTIKGSFQRDLKALMAQVDPDTLTMEAGTTRKIDVYTRGAAFAGLEFKNLRKFNATIENTFYAAPHLFGKGLHAPPWNVATNVFAGLVIDYHTPAGYTKRVRLAVGVMSANCTSVQPAYGKPTESDLAHDLGVDLIEVPSAEFALDLQKYAPADWDGQVWLSVGSDWVASDRRLTLKITSVNDAVTSSPRDSIDPKAYEEAYSKPKSIEVTRSPGGILIDGQSNEEMWRGAGKTEPFFLINGKGMSRATTTAMAMYDDEHLFVTFTCKEPSRRKPLIQGGAVWDDDEVEVWIDHDGDGVTYRQVIVSAANETAEFAETGPVKIGAKSAVYVEEGEYWSVEVMIPYKGLGVSPPKPGDTWRVGLGRYRPSGADFNSEAIVWSSIRGDGFKDLANFGTFVFK